MSHRGVVGDDSSDRAWCRVDEVQGRAVVTVVGEFDGYVSPQRLREAVHLAERFSDRVVLELSQVRSLGPTALGVLVGVIQRFRDNDGAVSLLAPSEAVTRAMASIDFDHVPVVTSLQAALDALARPEPDTGQP